MRVRNRHSAIFLLLIVFNLVSFPSVVGQQVAALQPDRITIIQYIMDERPVLVELLTTAGLVPMLSGDNTFTLLAPPEQALASLKKESPDKIKEVLSGYIIPGSYLENDFKDGADVETMKRNKLRVCRKNGTLLNGVLLTNTNQKVRNGVIHQLQDMLN